MATPEFKRLRDELPRSRLIQLRDAVKPILTGNYLPSFTDHTDEHSDRLCKLVDDLTQPLAEGHELNPNEAFILYAACYLHDVGLQHQRADQTPTIQKVMQKSEYTGRRWDDLMQETRQKIVRKEHHRISGDMVRQSIDAPQPTVLGIQLTQEWHPGAIAALCVAHCLDTASEEYRRLTAESGHIRMDFLAALLRLADICDESRRRSHVVLEQTRKLDLESKSHWWRHYYVSDVVIDPETQTIKVWFDFPVDHRAQYRELFQSRETPEITAEFARHRDVLAGNGLHWSVRSADTPEAQCTTRPMDDDLERYLAEQLARRQEEQAERDRLLILKQLKANRPKIQQNIDQLRSKASTMSAEELFRQFKSLADHLWQLDGHCDEWTLLSGEFHGLKPQLSADQRLSAALDIAEMMLKDDYPEGARTTLYEFQPSAAELPDDDSRKYRFFLAFGHSCVERYALTEAAVALQEAARLCSEPTRRATIEAELFELELLQGIADNPELAANGGGEQ
jgi:hypothetical protein